jgi:fucose permease
MAIAGGALLPLIYGSLADMATIGQQKAYYLMVPCYAFIFFYALRGYKTR